MTGKQKCELLKEIRKNMAKENGIPYEPRECHHEGYCTGTCPLCEKEATELLLELKKKEKNGEEIQTDTEAIEALEQIADRSEEIENEEDVELLGDIPSDFFERNSLSDEEQKLEKRILEEERYRRALAKAESKSQKLGLFGRLLKKLYNRINPPLMGEPLDEVEYEIPKKGKMPLMGDIASNQWLNQEVKNEHGPDIIWNMDGEEKPVISPSANIVNNENGAVKIVDDDVFSLSRFLRAQEYESGGYKDALQEVKDGHKRKHWIWYIFPQINGLGHSDYQEYYGIKSLEEARAYLGSEILGTRLREISEALLQLEDTTTLEIFGSTDSMKVKSCMTLFDIVSPHEVFEKVLNKYYQGKRCELTLNRFGFRDDTAICDKVKSEEGTNNDNQVVLDKTDIGENIKVPANYFMVCVDEITLYVSIQDNEESWIVKRHIDGVDVIFEDKWREYYDRTIPYLEEAKEISEEDFINVKNSMTEIPHYIETRDKRGECCYLRMCAEDGTAYYEFKHNHPLRGVLADGWDGDVHKTKFDGIDERSYEGMIASISVNGAGSNILSKQEFEEWWKRGR